METLSIHLKNCYGINKLDFTFNFNLKKGCLVYASNGVMKTSFANTFLAISENREPEDKIHHEKPICNIKKKANESAPFVNIESNDIFVIESFNDKIYNESVKFDNITFLLVKEDLKQEYDDIYKNIKITETNFLNKIKSLLGINNLNKIKEAFLNDFDNPENNFLEVLLSIKTDIAGIPTIPVNQIKYQTLFNDKSLSFLQKENISDLVKKYANKYSELIEKSEIFEKNVFNHNNAMVISKQLESNHFFDAGHKISLKSRSDMIGSQSELEKIIQDEKKSILSESELTEWFEEIDSALNKNKELRDFRDIIENHKGIIPEFKDIPKFKREIWISIFKSEIESYFDLVNIYESSKMKLEEIIQIAREEKADWEEVVELFNNRFQVPFELKVSNQEDVILKNDVPVVKFLYKDIVREDVYLENETLFDVLSNGEKRALYLLYIIYEIQIKRKNGQPTLIIADDIVDSFDYQNKYAIVEYLNDILKDDIFKIIILTHNFDFYRTVGSRLNIGSNSFVAVKDYENNKIKLFKGSKYQENIFQKWKTELTNDNFNNRIFIATIPFIRNLIEYINGTNGDNYSLLTSLLHIKNNTKSIKFSNLVEVYKDIWNLDIDSELDDKIYNLVFIEAEKIIEESSENLKLENKIVLSIAIRYLAEEIMISKIDDETITSEIYENQTRILFNEFKDKFEEDPLLTYFENVNLMTTENIHINSFMYEPILDMTDYHLKELYKNIKDARDSTNET